MDLFCIVASRQPAHRGAPRSSRSILDDFETALPGSFAAPASGPLAWPAAFGIGALRTLGLACACLVAGWLAEQAGAPPLFWPPAGIALAALLAWGLRALPGVAGGALALAWLDGRSGTAAALELGVQLLIPTLAYAPLRALRARAPLTGWRAIAALPFAAVAGPLAAALLLALLYASGALPSDAVRRPHPLGAEMNGLLLVGAWLLSLPGSAAWRRPRLRDLGAPALVALAALPALAGPPALAPLILVPLLVLAGVGATAPRGVAPAAALALATLAWLATARHLGPFAALDAYHQTPWLAAYAWAAALLALLLQGRRGGERVAVRRRDHRLLDAAGVGHAHWRLDRGQALYSPTWAAMLGGHQDAGDDPVHWLEQAHPMDRERVADALCALLATAGAPVLNERLRIAADDGGLGATKTWRWHALRAEVLARDAAGQATRLETLLSDVEALAQAEERQRIGAGLFRHLQEGLLVVDAQARVVDVNPSYCRIMGQSRDSLLKRPAALLAPATLQRSGLSLDAMQQALREQGHWRARLQAERGDGTPCALQLTVATVEGTPGAAPLRVLTITDLGLQLEQERERDCDALTGLPNQEAFMRALRHALGEAGRGGFLLCVCVVDFDRFGDVNQRWGEAAGDALLAQAAQRMRQALRNAPHWSDGIGRLGGDEFALFLRATDLDEARRAVERLKTTLRGQYQLGATGQAVELSASIGVTVHPDDAADAETLLRHAGHALYRAKQHGGADALRFFDVAKRARDEAGLLHLARMQQALDRGELCLHYQPKIDMQAGRVLGVEALLRWQHPEQGLLMPGEFLPQIESTGLALRIGDWIIEQALLRSAQWLAQGLALQVSVNVTPRQLQTPEFAQRLQELLQRHPEPVARHLCIEVLETAALADVDATHALILRCRGFGVRFALDDFGTGYSTLTYLKKLPVDTLKIDRSFVQGMLVDPQDMALVEGVVGLARHFDCEVVAEGVESAAHARALLRLGCRQGQGNGIAAAMPAFEVAAWVEAFGQLAWLAAPSADAVQVDFSG